MNTNATPKGVVYIPCSRCHLFFTKNDLIFVQTRGIISVPFCKIHYDAFYANSQQGKFISFNKAVGY